MPKMLFMYAAIGNIHRNVKPGLEIELACCAIL